MAGGRKGRNARVQLPVKGKVAQLGNEENSPDLSKIARSLNKELECLSAEHVSSAMKVLDTILKPLDANTQKLVRNRLSDVIQKPISPVCPSNKSWADEVEAEEGNGTVTTEVDNAAVDNIGIEQGKSSSPWDLFDVSKLSSAGFKLQYIEPEECSGKKFGKIVQQDVQSEITYWNNAVVVYILGANPPYAIMNGFLRRIWGKYGVDKIVMAKNGMMLAHFETSVGRDDVLEAGIFHFDNKPLIVRPWTENFEMHGCDVKKVPIWVKLPHLDIRYWSPICISKICSVIGHPIMVDRNTEERTGINFVRALVEVDVGGVFPTEVLFQNTQGRLITQEVAYEWKPTVCSFCDGIGHEEQICKKKLPKKIWQPKKPTQPIVEQQTQPVMEKQKQIDEEWKSVQRKHTLSGQGMKRAQKDISKGCTSNSFAVLEEGEKETDDNHSAHSGDNTVITVDLSVLKPSHAEPFQPGHTELEILQTPGDSPHQGNG